MKVIAGLILGVVLAIFWVASEVHYTADECRAAHPGFDCRQWWVAGERLK